MKWDELVEGLNLGTEFLKLGTGTHKVEFLDEGEEKVITYDGKDYQKVFFKVKCNNKEYTWSVSKGTTYGSLFGQIALFGKYNKGLTHKTVTVLVKGEGKSTDYTIMESVDLAQKEVKSE